MNEVNHFSKLDLDELKSRAIGWMDKFSSIQEIALYRAVEDDFDDSDDYYSDVEDDDQMPEPTKSNLEYVLVAKVPGLPAIKNDKALLNYYSRFVDGRFRFTSVFSRFGYRDIQNFFYQKENAKLEEWFWATIPPGKEGWKNLEGMRLVKPETRLLLNSRDTIAEQSVIDHKSFPAKPFDKKTVDYSQKTKEERKALVNAWFEKGVTRRDIAKLLFKDDFESGRILLESLIKRVARLKE